MERDKYYLFGITFLPMTRIRVLILALFLVFTTTSIGFAIWDSTDNPFSTPINLGEGNNLIVAPITERPNDVYWVPLGAFKGPMDIDHYLYQFDLLLLEEGNVKVSLENSFIDGDIAFDLLDAKIALSHDELLTASNLLSIDFTEEGPFYDRDDNVFRTTVYVMVFFNTPSDIETFNRMQNGEVSFEIHFKGSGFEESLE